MPRSEQEAIDLLNGYHMHDGLLAHKHLSSLPHEGQKVLIIHPPADIHEEPGWVPAMNSLRGLSPYTVQRAEDHRLVRLVEDPNNYNFKASWLCHELPEYLRRPPQVGDHVWLPHKPANSTAPITWMPEIDEHIGGMYEVAVVNNGVVRVKTIPSGREISWNFWYEWFAKLPPSLQQYAEEENDDEQRTTINNVTIIKTPHWIGFIYPKNYFYQTFFRMATRRYIIEYLSTSELVIYTPNEGRILIEQWTKHQKLMTKYQGKKIKDVLCEVTSKHIKLHGRWKKSITEAEATAASIKTLNEEKIWFGSDGNERLTYYYKADVYVEHENEQKIPEIIRRYRYEVA